MDDFEDFQVTRLPKSNKSSQNNYYNYAKENYSNSSDPDVDYAIVRDSQLNNSILDHMWYDRDDDSCMMYNNYDEENSYYLESRERKRLSQLPHNTQLVNNNRILNSAGKFGAKKSQKHIDDSLWELNRLRQGGGGSKFANAELEQLRASNVHKDETKKIVLVRNIIPPFIYEVYNCNNNSSIDQLSDELTETGDTFNDIYNKFLNQSVSTVKDPTSDIALMAKKGSQILKHMKDELERSSSRTRFWDLTNSKIGNLIFKQTNNTKNKNTSNSDPEVGERRGYMDDTEKEGEEELKKMKENLESVRKSLPVFQHKHEIISLIQQFQVIILVGETGSGKTTQLPQYLYEAGFGDKGIIGCTQPRRVAAMSVSKRVASEMGSNLGDIVGYTIRFEDVTSNSTRVKFMTDGILLRESLMDSDLEKYSVVIMDEAHERSLNTDVLFGILKSVLTRRWDFRLIVTSATIQADKFSAFFGNCPIFHIKGRTYPVSIEYMRSISNDYVDSAVEKCISIHISQPPGDILIFMTGQDDINITCELLDTKLYKLIQSSSSGLIQLYVVLPIYSTLPIELQQKVFMKYPYRKIIVSTNIAETSITFEGIRYVIDSGYCKLKVYNSKVGVDSLQICPVSQAGANQRSGRAGRTGPGVCYRLYTQRIFINDLFENNIPEIKRTNLCNVVLLLKSLKIVNLLSFDFIDPPSIEAILSAMLQLYILNAIDELGQLTTIGNKMVQFPLEPSLSKIIITAIELNCLDELLTIVSVLSSPNIYLVENTIDKENPSSLEREKFMIPESDHLSLLNVYNNWRNNNYSQSFCSQYKLQYKSLKRAKEIKTQLQDIVDVKYKHIQQGDGERLVDTVRRIVDMNSKEDLVRLCVCSGYFNNASKLKGFGEYYNLRSFIPCYLHPTSALYGMGYTPEYVVYHEVVITTKEYMRFVTTVEPEWLYELAPNFFYLKNFEMCEMVQKSRDRIENKRLLQDLKIKKNVTETKPKEVKKDFVQFGSKRKRH
ncbi:DEAD-box family helicase, putative [Theileria annulata]|uniref:RNA helicase n=1 Tax=Theileria annulata TaxID=5874 RepID=Q4UC45_THEAN|nr:DEAD-box family helicase, putative [Theileria annulata]CAI75606.1 DEAD-box family helicase, putative [Theileria annulata]|eukprot:XP_955082.1 DEAD-box family helicase, putative [Theileria annulata]